MSNVKDEARKLYDLGFAIIWVMPKAKRPVASGWTTGPRTPWAELDKTYREGYNVGVRTGAPSKVGAGFLAVIDVDIKDPAFKAAALLKVRELIGEQKCPIVMSGSGGGSRHYYCVTPKPFKMLTVLKVKDQGEVCVYSDGRQMVLPPSATTGQYKWVAGSREYGFPLIDFAGLVNGAAAAPGGLNVNPEDVLDIETFPKVDLAWLPISDRVKNAIIKGDGVTDRSGYLLQAASALHSAGLSRDEILSVLTDPKLFLGQCAYDHAKTASRKRAAEWLWKYTVKKVIDEKSSKIVFAAPLEAQISLSDAEQTAQDKAMKAEAGTRDWRHKIARSGKDGMGPPAQSIKNVVLILSNAVSPLLVRRNEFALRDTYSLDTPWGSKKDALISDDDIPRIIYWLGVNWYFEPNERVVSSALTVLALRNSYDPVRDWLDGLSAWDKKPRLGTWLANHFEAQGDPEYLGQVFSKWLAAMVRRVYEPGAKFDWMPIFEGPQGAGKSSFGRVLVGDKLFLDWLPNLADKDSMQALQGQWAVEMGELPQFKRNELETIKAFITRTVDKFRPPFGRRLIDSPRRCVFFGTTNRKTYLIDDTGNRRFKPIEVGQLNFEVLRAERDQLFAEAIHLYRTKYNTDLSFELTGAARVFEAKIHQEKMLEDEASVMTEAMQDFVIKVQKNEQIFNFKKFRILELFSGVGPLIKWPQNTRNFMFAAKMLKKFGGEKNCVNGLNYWKISVEVDTSPRKGTTEDFY